MAPARNRQSALAFVRRHLADETSPITLALAVAVLVLAQWSMLTVLEDPYAEGVLPYAGLLAFVGFGAWTQAELIFARRLERLPERMTSRTFLPGPLLAVLCAVLHAATAWPGAGALAERFPEVHGASHAGAYAATVFLTLVAEFAMSLLGSLIGMVYLLVPALAIWRPHDLVAHTGRNAASIPPRLARRASLAFSFVLMSAFTVPTLHVYSDRAARGDHLLESLAMIGRLFAHPERFADHLGDLARVLAVLHLVAGALLLWYLVRAQRAKRRRAQ